MTFIQPKKESSFVIKILIVLSIPLIIEGMLVVVLYNHVVDFNHGIVEMTNEYQLIQAENGELKDHIFSTFTSDNLTQFAAERNLVKDSKPFYFTLGKQWVFASH